MIELSFILINLSNLLIMKEKIDQIKNEFIKIQNFSAKNKMTEQELFYQISKLEKKFKGNPYYDFSIDGLICNLGSDHKHISVINYAISRLKEKIKINEHNKHIYDLGNCILAIADIECPYPYSVNSLIETNKFNEVRIYFSRVQYDKYTSYERALTNSANILEKYGRNFEAIYLYDKVLNVNGKFGMALANKAKAIDYYIRLSPYKSFRLMRKIVILYTKALDDDSIVEVGGPATRETFSQNLNEISAYLGSHGQLNIVDKIKIPKSISKYLRFCLERNLFLNYDFGYYYDKHSVEDSFFPSFVENPNEKQIDRNSIMSERIYFSFQVFNQVLESYTAARLHYYQSLSKNYDNLDKLIHYTYTYDYTRHGYRYGIFKSIFLDLYNCLDKIGHLIYYYFSKNGISIKKDIYFNWLLNDSFKEVILEKKNFQLLALRNLALDFEDGYQYNYLNKIRNRITHSFLNINEGIAYDEKFSSYEITEEMLSNAVEDLFLILKAAIMYSVIAISSVKPDGLIFPITATPESQIFF